ncbi:hypothetical protein [Streptomyces carminius]|uniref:hypothetical protein n=1 Tax=Streptomyces carminius TaxID=2665496 RepID=UPI001E47E733|nr:hypothetical protein [Streptomyces carminius]
MHIGPYPDITEHPTREGEVYCAAVLDTYSRQVVGRSLDSPRPPGHINSRRSDSQESAYTVVPERYDAVLDELPAGADV